MSTSIERVLNNPYLLADIMRHVAMVDKAPNVLSTLRVSRAFRNPHVIRETLKSIDCIYEKTRNRVTEESVTSYMDIDYVNGTMECGKLHINKLLPPGTIELSEKPHFASAYEMYFIIEYRLNRRIDKVVVDEPILDQLRRADCIGPLAIAGGEIYTGEYIIVLYKILNVHQLLDRRCITIEELRKLMYKWRFYHASGVRGSAHLCESECIIL